MSVIGRIRARLARDDGFTLAEIAIATLLGAVLMGALGGFVINAMKAGSFAQGQSATLNDARNAVQNIEKEARGAERIDWCAPLGSCLEIDAQTATGSFRQVRYNHTGTELQRQTFNPDTEAWSDAVVVIQRVTNTGAQPVFSNSSCDESSITLQRVVIDLRIQPTPNSGPSLQIETSFRPRNFPSVATCPTPSP